MKVVVNPGHTLWDGRQAHPAGSVVDVDPSQVGRLTAGGVISDPYKPLLPTAAQASLADFRANSPVAAVDGEGEKVALKSRRSRSAAPAAASAEGSPRSSTPDPNNGVSGTAGGDDVQVGAGDGGQGGDDDDDDDDGEGEDDGAGAGGAGVDDALASVLPP